VITRPLPELFREYGVRYVLLDRLFVQLEELELQGCVQVLGRWGDFGLLELDESAR